MFIEKLLLVENYTLNFLLKKQKKKKLAYLIYQLTFLYRTFKKKKINKKTNKLIINETLI
jgi:hypothetical protein